MLLSFHAPEKHKAPEFVQSHCFYFLLDAVFHKLRTVEMESIDIFSLSAWMGREGKILEKIQKCRIKIDFLFHGGET